MPKRERRVQGLVDRRQRVVLVAVVALYCQDVSAIYHPTASSSSIPFQQRGCLWKSHLDTSRNRINRLIRSLQSRGGASGVNWDEPYYSDSSDGEEQTSNFLPNAEDLDEDEDESETPKTATGGDEVSATVSSFESEGEEEYDDEDSEILDSPFLQSFQREIHSIVRDYRQEVSETFQHLMDDVIYSQGRPPIRRSGRPTAQDSSRKGEWDTPKTPRAPVDMMKEDSDSNEEEEEEEEDNNNNNDYFIVGDSDEDDDEVLLKLNHDPRRRYATTMGNDESDNDEDALGLKRKTRDEGNAASIESEIEDEEDGWDTASKVSWDSPLEKSSRTDKIAQDYFEKRESNGSVRGHRQEPGKDEIESNSNSAPSKARKKRRKRKQSPALSASGGDQSSSKSSTDARENQPGFVDPHATYGLNTPGGIGVSSIFSSQMWKSVSVAVSFLAMAILLNMVVQILSRMLWTKPF